ncbi:MAG: extracellular solute-binding protein [Anaerolineae bacterium]|nr:extracellular solute-binding protein [Anaerolineae bacterium]
MRLRYFAVVLGILAACTTQSAQPTAMMETEVIETATAPPAVLPTNVTAATAEPTATGPTTLTIWWPEPLAAIDNQDAADLLSEEISAFQSANPDVVVEFRLKKVQDVGGIMSTLRSANLVAPRALPDLTLMRRSDLLTAAQAGLIMAMDERSGASILNNLPPIVGALGQVNDRLYGLAYNIEVQHLVYQAGAYTLDSWSFAEVLDQHASFVFPAGRANSLSDVFLAQYRAATGTLDSGDLPLDADHLQTLFQFYQDAVETGVIDPIVLEYIVPGDYRAGLASGTIPAGVVTSSLYLTMNHEALAFAPIPTISGDPTTVVDGWMWVLTTADAEQQAQALRFINWMLDIDRQGRYNQAISMLPSQRATLRQWEDPAYATFINMLLNNATLPLSEGSGSLSARVIQTALASVISGQRTAAQATQDVIAQLPG